MITATQIRLARFAACTASPFRLTSHPVTDVSWTLVVAVNTVNNTSSIRGWLDLH